MEKKPFRIFTTAFADGGLIPSQYTADGSNISPQLQWEGAPPETKSFALINDDPDAPVGLWVHWLVKDIPATATGIPEAGKIGVEVKNSFGFTKYGGPAPPSGTHRYFFKLYALSVPKMAATTKDAFYKEVEKKKIAEASYMGRYARKGM